MVFYVLLLILLGVTIFNLYIRYRRAGRLTNAVPGPHPYPIIGNMIDFDLSSQVKVWKVMRNITKNYYPITRVWMCTEAVFSVIHPDDIEILLTSQKAIEKGFVYEILHPWLRTGLLTSTGEKWRQRRKMLTPAFHFNILSKYMEITREQGESLVKYLCSFGEKSVQSLLPFCSKFTLNIICESAMGVALDKIDTAPVDKYKNAIYRIGDIAVYRMTRPFIRNWMLKLVPFLKINQDQKQCLETLHKFTDNVVNERKEYHKSTGYKYLAGFEDGAAEFEEEEFNIGRKKRLAMLDLLLSLERDGLIDEAGIKEEVDTFTFEGHDTTAMAMTYTLMLLAENKGAQDRARAEVTEVADANGGKIGLTEIQECQYLERCIKESMRLYPPVATILRKVEEDLQLKHCLLPAGANVILHVFDVHRDANFWDEPEKFDPDRFLPEQCHERHPFAYIPFSAGPRNCIGQRFAMNELKSLVARILYNLHLEPIDRLADIDLIADLVIRPSKPVNLKFIKIDKQAN